jgi:hypothetical protein
MPKNTLRIIAVLSLAVVVTSCKKRSGGYLTDPSPVEVSQIKVSPPVQQLPPAWRTIQLGSTVFAFRRMA